MDRLSPRQSETADRRQGCSMSYEMEETLKLWDNLYTQLKLKQ
jgi:hypothetical protein